MTESDGFNVTVYLKNWTEEDFALLCGIANAGGGRVVVSSTIGNHARKMKRLRKSFETIPRISRQELGLDCTTEPLVDGADLYLEIQVPPAEAPLQYRGIYYLYTDGINTVVTEELLERLSATGPREAAAPKSPDEADEPSKRQKVERQLSALDSDGRPAFNDRSIAAANRLDLTSTDEYVLKVLRTNGRATATRIADLLVVSESTVRRSFRKLRECGLIERIGSRKAGYWRIVD